MGDTRRDSQGERGVDNGFGQAKHVFGTDNDDNEGQQLPRDHGETDAQKSADADTHDHTDKKLRGAGESETEARVHFAELDKASRDVDDDEGVGSKQEDVGRLPS